MSKVTESTSSVSINPKTNKGSIPAPTSSLNKYKDLISRYEDPDDPLAPLTEVQQEFILNITHGDVRGRSIPEHLRVKSTLGTQSKSKERTGLPLSPEPFEGYIPIPTGLRAVHVPSDSEEPEEDSEDEGMPTYWELDSTKSKDPVIDQSKFQFKTKQEFNEWFSGVEKKLEATKDKDILNYIGALEGCKGVTNELLDQVSSALEELKLLEENYHFVSNKTNALHNSCQELIEEQTKLESLAREVEGNLNHFLELEKIASKLSSPSILVTSGTFFLILEQIDTCLSYMVHNPDFKESSVYAAKYKHCLNRAISLIKLHVNRTLQEATAQVTTSALAPVPDPNNQSDGNETGSSSNVFPLIYGKFSAGVSQLKKLFTEIENRRTSWPEYTELFSEIQQSFFKERKNLLNGSISDTVTHLNARGKTGVDLCAVVRNGCSFCIHLCQDEFRLYGDFFNTSYTILFDEFMENLCTPIYETLRPLIIKIQHLETLSELCSILRVEMLEEHAASNPLGLNSFIRIVEELLHDTQERLVYRAHIYISTDIRNYNPGPGDLAYPEKLQMMEQIAEGLGEHPEDLVGSRNRSASQSSLASMNSVTSQEVASINSLAAIQIPRPLKSSSSPADLHGMWFPSVRRTLLCLSKLYRCLDKAIFQGLSQEALSACIANVSSSAQSIASKKTIVDAQLFEIKHLLILREQIAPFQADFSVKETSLDFSRVKVAAMSLLQKKKQLFSLGSNNSLLEFIVDGTPQVREYFLDSKKDVDKQLKGVCEQFIAHCTQVLIGPLKGFLTKALRVIEAQKEKPDLVLGEQSFALPNTVVQLIQDTVESLKSMLPFIHRSMKLYLANRETEFILFRPIKNNVLNGFLQLENVTVVHYSEANIICPTQDHINALISSVMIQSS